MFVGALPRWRLCRRQGTAECAGRSTRTRGGAVLFACGDDASVSSRLALVSNGLPGRMALEVAQAALRRDLELVPFSLTGERTATAAVECTARDDTTGTERSVQVQLVRPAERAQLATKLKKEYPNVICVDFTQPQAVIPNAAWYVENGFDFVMGTTGGDTSTLYQMVARSARYAVIAPNMAKQIVAFQALVELLGREFPNAFRGYRLEVIESHQASKLDTSGTAKAVVASMLQSWGITGFGGEQDIQKIRDPALQVSRMGVPESCLQGHAFHTYRLTSPDGSVRFVFQHNVCGRRVYAEGTIDAVCFLDRQRRSGADQKIYDMIDVLRSGGML